MPEKPPETKPLSDEKNNPKNSSDGDDKGIKDKRKRKDKIKPLTKVIIRRLPPTMTEDTFLKQIDPIPDYDYFYFVPADMSLGQNASARAYINFSQQDDIFIFKDKFDGYVFVDGKGSEYPAIVEFAPFQGLSKIKSRKKDNKCNTIEEEPHFLQFLESLKNDEDETGKQEMKMEYSYQIKDDKKITSTPLLEYIASKKQARREERRKKIDDRKKHREDEKNRKQNQMAKNIPASIQEEDDDGIIVRTIKSRSFERGGLKNKERVYESSGGGGGGGGGKLSKSDDKHKAYREERDRKRDERRKAERERRDEQRQKNRDEHHQPAGNKNRDDRDRNRDERDRNRKDRQSGSGAGKTGDRRDQNPFRTRDDKKTESTTSKSSADNQSAPIKEEKVKKYSESRRERFNRLSTDANKSDKNVKIDKEPEKLAAEAKNDEKSNEDKTTVKETIKIESKINVEKIIKKDVVDEKKIEKKLLPDETNKNESKKDVVDEKKIEEKLLPDEMNENDSNVNDAADKPPSLPITKNSMPDRQSSLDDGRRSSSSGEGGSTGKDDAQLRRIRNKDRPSLQIYQPGKRRLASTPSSSSSSSNLPKNESSKSSSPPPPIAVSDSLPIEKNPTPSTSSQILNEPPTKIESVEIVDNSVKIVETLPKKDTAHVIDSSATPSTFDETKKSEKKVTRYSERRNRARAELRISKGDKIAATELDEKIVDHDKSSNAEPIDKITSNEVPTDADATC